MINKALSLWILVEGPAFRVSGFGVEGEERNPASLVLLSDFGLSILASFFGGFRV